MKHYVLGLYFYDESMVDIGAFADSELNALLSISRVMNLDDVKTVKVLSVNDC